MSRLSIDTDKPLYVLLEYKNNGPELANNVTMILNGGSTGLRMSVLSTYFGNAKDPDGVFVSSKDLIGPGINVGSYAAGGGTWIIAELSVSIADDIGACESTEHTVEGIVVSDRGRRGLDSNQMTPTATVFSKGNCP